MHIPSSLSDWYATLPIEELQAAIGPLKFSIAHWKKLEADDAGYNSQYEAEQVNHYQKKLELVEKALKDRS